jgi:hypothetical protein
MFRNAKASTFENLLEPLHKVFHYASLSRVCSNLNFFVNRSYASLLRFPSNSSHNLRSCDDSSTDSRVTEKPLSASISSGSRNALATPRPTSTRLSSLRGWSPRWTNLPNKTLLYLFANWQRFVSSPLGFFRPPSLPGSLTPWMDLVF